ncbi:hypothetical protein BpHYR1_047811, partial [Brachionus plicatilis]
CQVGVFSDLFSRNAFDLVKNCHIELEIISDQSIKSVRQKKVNVMSIGCGQGMFSTVYHQNETGFPVSASVSNRKKNQFFGFQSRFRRKKRREKENYLRGTSGRVTSILSRHEPGKKIELNNPESITEFSKFQIDLNKLATEAIEKNRLISVTNANIVMIQQRTRTLNKKGECLRPYALKNYGINFPHLELEKINIDPDLQQDVTFYRYTPTANPSLQAIGNESNVQLIPSSLIQSKNRYSKFTNNSPDFNSNKQEIKRLNSEEGEEETLFFSQEKSLTKHS